jgi:hypothetical protein
MADWTEAVLLGTPDVNTPVALLGTPDVNTPVVIASTRPQRFDSFNAVWPDADVEETLQHFWIDHFNGVDEWQTDPTVFGTYICAGGLPGGPVCVSNQGNDDIDLFANAKPSPDAQIALYHRH